MDTHQKADTSHSKITGVQKLSQYNIEMYIYIYIFFYKCLGILNTIFLF